MDPGNPAAARPISLRRLPDAGWVLLIFGVTLLIYSPALQGGLIWDDEHHVTVEALRSLHGLWRIWFEVGATQQYYPLLHSAFWLEHWLWGDATLGYHLVNVACHATSACLFAAVLRRLWGPGGRGSEWLAALLFAVHPVGVESVAWISEQKNTLSTVFYLLAALTYLRFDRERRGRTYGLAFGLFAAALLCKTVTATLPAALLVALWWRRGSLSWRRDAVPLLPWLGLGAAAGLFSGWVERTYIGAQGAGFDLSLAQRCLIAGRDIFFYLGKLLWPANLVFIYPRWTVDAAVAGQWLFPLGVVVLLAGLWALRRWNRGPLAALLFFAGTLFPILGFFNVYPFRFSFVADHWQYLASLGILALAAGGWARWAASGPESAASRVPAAAAIGLVAVLAALSWRQSPEYADGDTLYEATLAQNPDCWLAHNNLANRLLQEGRLAEAVGHYQAAARLDPSDPESDDNLGIALAFAGRREEAMASFREALRLRPDYADAHYNLGLALSDAGRLPEAIEHYAAALRAGAGRAEIRNNLGTALAREGRLPEAIAQFEEALRLQPDFAAARTNLELARRLAGPQLSQP
jgi:tetratricopeptide (TPR) repeat protein